MATKSLQASQYMLSFTPALIISAGLVCSSYALAQDTNCVSLAPNYPAHTVTMIVPFPPGGQSDLVGNIVADRLSKRLGKTVILEHKSGAGGGIGYAAAAKAEPDGSTILLAASGSFLIGPSIYKTKLFDPIKDFKPVAYLVASPQVLLVRKDLPAGSTTDLIKLAHEKPGTLTLAVPGLGTVPHIAGEVFKRAAKVDITNVVYRGGGPAINDLIGGQVDIYIDSVMTALPQVEAGSVRALAVMGASRSPQLPDVPAINEVLPGFEMYTWWGAVVPARTPEPIAHRLNCELNALLSDEQLVTRFSQMGTTTNIMSQAQFSELIAKETERFRKIVEESGIRVE